MSEMEDMGKTIRRRTENAEPRLKGFWLAFVIVMILGAVDSMFFNHTNSFENAVTLCILMGFGKFLVS